MNYTDYRGEVCQGLIMPKGFDIESELTKEPVALKEPQQVFRFLTELTNQQGTVKTLDELLLLKPQQLGEGFILQVPKSKESGGRYYSSPEPAVARPVVEAPVSPAVPNLSPMGQLEKRILRFLRNAGIEQDVMASQEFHLRIENEPFIPLVVERQGDELYLTHYLTQNGDMFIDSEMVFRVRGEGHIEFKETAVQSLRGGASRLPNRAFAQIFSKNIVQQGFAEFARAQFQAQAAPGVAGFPVQSLHKYLDRLTQHGEVVIAEGAGAIAVHPHQPPALAVEEQPQLEPEAVANAPATEEPEFQVQSLFDVEPFRTGHPTGQGP